MSEELNVAKMGLMQPIKACQFRTTFESGVHTEKELLCLSTNVTAVKMDLKKRELTITIRQVADSGEMISKISLLVTSPKKVKVSLFNGSISEPVSNYEVSALKCKEHEFKLDYANSNAAEHILVIQFGVFDYSNPEV
jgi:hypothetical protein